MVSEAQKKAVLKYQKEKTDDIRVRTPKGTKDRWKAAADKEGLSLQRYIINTVEDRIAGEQDGQV